MTWDYSGNPADSDKDKVRFLVGDTDTNDRLVEDEEINWALSEYPSVYVAAAEICEAIAAKFARKVDQSVGDLRISFSKQSDQYSKKAAQLRRKSSILNVKPYAGGISVSDKETVRENSDRVDPSFTRGMDDYDSVSNPDDPKRLCD